MTNFSALTSAELVFFYNENCGDLPMVKRFSDRATAIKRCLSIVPTESFEQAEIVEQIEAQAAPTSDAKPFVHVHGICPACGAEDQVPAGVEGTAAGEDRSYCNYCYVTYDNDTGKIVKEPKASTTRSIGIAVSWTNAATRASRSERTGVTANGFFYKSLAKAFAYHQIPMRGFIQQRLILKAAGHIVVNGITFNVAHNA